MLPIQYTYLFGASLFLIPWIVIYSARKDLRKPLIIIGLLFTVLGLIGEYYWWTKDWWRPFTITNTKIGIEDIILGFGNSGIAASLYVVLFKKKFVHNSKVNFKNRLILLGIIILFHLILFSILFNLSINSFVCTLIIMFSASSMLLIKKKDLILPAIISGLLMTVLVIPVYEIMTFVTPVFIEKTWFVENLTGLYILNVPIEDCIFYFLSGLLCFSVYPFCKDSKIENLSKQ